LRLVGNPAVADPPPRPGRGRGEAFPSAPAQR